MIVKELDRYAPIILAAVSLAATLVWEGEHIHVPYTPEGETMPLAVLMCWLTSVAFFMEGHVRREAMKMVFAIMVGMAMIVHITIYENHKFNDFMSALFR